jgi:hypothetical protein
VLKNRPLLLILASLVLGVLVVLDNWHDDAAPAPGPAAPADAAAQAAADEEAAAADSSAEGRQAPTVPLDNPLATIPAAELKDWVGRPLFAPSRKRPPSIALGGHQAGPAAAPRAPSSYDLLGILREGERAIALLRSKREGWSFRVEVGDTIGGWRVTRMEPKSILLEREDGTSQTVPLLQE